MTVFRKRKGVFKRCWRFLSGTRSDEDYRRICGLLDEAGLDYRVWMDENEPGIVFRREYFGDPAAFRRHYGFYVRRCDYAKACRAVNFEVSSLYTGGIGAIFF